MTDRHILGKAGLLAALLASATVAQAQSPVGLKQGTAPTGPDIVVTAKPDPTAKETVQQARAISRMGDFYHDPLARFSEPVCPGVLGLPADAAGIIVDRIRYDAERVGAPIEAATPCKANILIVFTRDGGAEVRKLLKTRGYLFDGIETPEARELKEAAGPVRAWNVTQLRNRHGQEQNPTFATMSMSIDSNPGFGPLRVINVPTSDSRVFLASRVDITASVVVIDLGAIDGMPVAQIADYAAMRALARTRPAEGDTAASTILSLFDPTSAHPREMTAFDLAYLRSLYDAGSNVPASVKLLNVSRMAAKDKALAMKDPAPGQ
ncbi:MAG TPA: hypothetical protein VGE65_03540 [Sphingobium sp.]